MMDIIKVKNLTKKFNGLMAVDDISFAIKEGEIFGLLGPNGAGKTTAIRILTGILKPTNGEVRIGGYNLQKNPLAAKQLMGIVPEMANAYMDLSALKNLLFMGELYGIKKEKATKKAEDLLKLFHLYEKRNQKVKAFSKGMKQRLILAMALMNEAKILFLDEPTGGLDVESVRLIRNLIGLFNQQGVTILLTTHDIEEANLLCDRVAIMNFGKIVAIDRPEKLKNTIQSTASIEVAFKKTVNEEKLKMKGVTEIKKEGDKFRLYSQTVEEVIPSLIKYAQDSGNKIMSLKTLGPSLEDVFIKLTHTKKQ
jgi:ABC-2 type transport system ATP-binding protein